MEMFQYMLDENDLMPRFTAAGLTDVDITFIKEQIAGPCPDTGKYVGRTGNKAFLYEVMNWCRGERYRCTRPSETSEFLLTEFISKLGFAV